MDKGIAQEAISLIKEEKTAWETSTVFITEKIAFDMRNLIRQCRQNYIGEFTEPIDPMTGRKKIWVPLTSSVVESVVKNVDLDTKDINFRAKKKPAYGLTHVVRSATKNNLDAIYFGEYLDEMERITSIDGTCVWKTLEKKVKGKSTFDIRNVDLLNLYLDPTAKSLQEAGAVIERAILPVSSFKEYKWLNTDELEGDEDLHPTEGGQTVSRGKIRYLDCWERWGLMPKYLLTGKGKDKDMVEGRIVISGMETNSEKIHLIELNKKEIKPYEEFWRRRLPWRWYGQGDAEMLMMMQLWLNITVNLRINRNYVEALGLYKLRKGAGITAQMLSRLTSNGVIQVNNIDDIQPMVLQAASQQSYRDADDAKLWGERITQAFEAITGETMPSSMTATVGVIQSRSAMSAFTMVKEGYGMSLQRWLQRHAMPIIQKGLTKGEIIRTTGEPEDIREIDRLIASHRAARNGSDIETELRALEAQGKERLVTLDQDIDISEYDVQVYVTNEEFDSSVIVQNLLATLNAAPEYREQIINQVFDLMGLNFHAQTQPMGTPQAQAVQPETKSMVDQLTQANQPAYAAGQ